MILKKVKLYGATIILMLVLFTILMSIAYALPNQRIEKNIQESFPQLAKEGEYHKIESIESISVLDNYTDALILNIALNRGMKNQENVLEKVAKNSFYKNEKKNIIQSLREMAQSEDVYCNQEYNHYWFRDFIHHKTFIIVF